MLVRKVEDARGKTKYEIKIKKAEDCSTVDLISEITSPTARYVTKLLKEGWADPQRDRKVYRMGPPLSLWAK